ncbi:hypothetical protein MGALJ_19660 [Mycobacterium gallinarum]|uniref:Uncharacterized protein n=1 Tax=Mycobacterium gallinarum TaxID=39689 RepID=A0A9W4BDQ1_9MYCO|nr:hypothetical protein [Mycobacterium gallinarum]BBY92297.1 hypothetical protein MGALJ_19660 [Mycobacterium gallinarum]
MAGRVVVAFLAGVLLVGCSGGRTSGDPAEWRSSVCRSGSNAGLNALVEGIDASDLQVCLSADSSAGSVYIASGNYSSRDSLDYYLHNYSAFRGRPYATASASGGGVWAFVAFVDGIGSGNPGVALKPLSEFGFELHSTNAHSTRSDTPTTTAKPTTSVYLPTTTAAPAGPTGSLSPTARDILAARVNDCVFVVDGPVMQDGRQQVEVSLVPCDGQLANYFVNRIEYVSGTPSCSSSAKWVRERSVSPPKVLCLTSMG